MQEVRGSTPLGSTIPPVTDPLILTLALDEAAFGRLDALRRAHFPAALNRIPAHVTLFHRLPGEAEGAVRGALRQACGGEAPLPVRFPALVPLGRGVALRAEAPGVAALRARLAAAWAAWLTPQDRQPWRPHATIQNKVAPEEARATLLRLAEGFAPWEATATGLLLWRYLGGPWERLAFLPFGLR